MAETKPQPVNPENVFVSALPHCGDCRVFLARGTDREIGPAAEDEKLWIAEHLPEVAAMLDVTAPLTAEKEPTT